MPSSIPAPCTSSECDIDMKVCAVQLQQNVSVLFVYALPGIGAAIALAVCFCLCATKASTVSRTSCDEATRSIDEQQCLHQPVRTPC